MKVPSLKVPSLTRDIVLFAALVTLVVAGFPFSTRSAGAALPPGGTFIDDDGNTHEGYIEAIAKAGITKGCNPPTNDEYCPSDTVERGPLAAMLRRALDLPNAKKDYFKDDNSNIFEADINAVAAAGITNGCNPPANDKYCPGAPVNRDQMATFVARSMGLGPLAVPSRRAPSPSAGSGVVWSSGLEPANLSEWAGVSNSGNADSEASSEIARTGNYSLAMTIEDSDAGTGTRVRVDNNVAGYSGAKNLPDDAYYSAWYFIPEHVTLHQNDNWNIYQWKQTCKKNGSYTRCFLESIKLVDLGDRYGFKLRSRTDSSGNWAKSNRIILAENTNVTVKAGEWFHVESRRVNDMGDNGRIITWINGQEVWDVTGITTEFDWDFPKWRRQWTVNNYNTGRHSPDSHSLYLDEARIALNRQGP